MRVQWNEEMTATEQRRASMQRWRIGTAGAAAALTAVLGIVIAKTDASGTATSPPATSSGSSGSSGPSFTPRQSPDGGFSPATPNDGGSSDFGRGGEGSNGPQTFSGGS